MHGIMGDVRCPTREDAGTFIAICIARHANVTALAMKRFIGIIESKLRKDQDSGKMMEA